MEQTIEKAMSKRWRIVLSVLIGILTALEAIRFIWRLSFFETYGWGNTTIHAVIVAFLLIALVLTIIGKRTPSLFAIFVIAFNLILMVVYPYNIATSSNMLYDKMVAQSQFLFSLPEPVFYLYLLVQVLLIVALWQYYFSEYLFREFWKSRRTENQIEFDNLLKKALAEMERK